MDGFEAAFSLASDLVHALKGSTLYGVAIWFLAAVFALSGSAKMRRPALAAIAMVNFRLVRRVRPAFGTALGLAEALLAVALALAATVDVFPLLPLSLAAALLWLFAALIARSLLHGEQFACFCFGEASGRLSRWSLVRTLSLASVASVTAVAAVSTEMHQEGHSMLPQAVSALALLSMLVLAIQVPPLIRWNRDPLSLGRTSR